MGELEETGLPAGGEVHQRDAGAGLWMSAVDGWGVEDVLRANLRQAHQRMILDEAQAARETRQGGDHFALARVGVPGTSLETGSDFIGRPAGWGKERKDEYTRERYHQPSDQVQPWFNYDGALQQLRVIVRAAVALGESPTQPAWARDSEFRSAGEARRTGT